VVLTESLTFPGFRAAASLFGVTLVGVAMDQQGVMPDALASACLRHKPRLIYLTPTIGRVQVIFDAMPNSIEQWRRSLKH
jgi:DNA-binding transcriptional MocR family regulator